jgi:tetratricopeptide (TPR) repeat protein
MIEALRNWISKLCHFRAPLNEQTINHSAGLNSFLKGKSIWKQNIQTDNCIQTRKSCFKEALPYFDFAIEKGCENADVFCLRASCLDALGFYYEALDDYNKCVSKKPTRGVADNYFRRALVKERLLDFGGAIDDISQAISLSKLPNEDNSFWNNHYKKMNCSPAAHFYENWLEIIKVNYESYKMDPVFAENQKKLIKRRDF